MLRSLLLLPLVALAACAPHRLSGGELNRVERPAFISRIQEGAGPRSHVFRQDDSYRPKLQSLDVAEADRRLAAKLAAALSRFEVAERMRAGVIHRLPDERPWNNALPPTTVAAALESFLVQEVPANPPDYQLLGRLGADAVVEFVVEEYGMHSRGGKAGVFVRGYGRMFPIGGGEVWRRPFSMDSLREGQDLDPFRVAREPEAYRKTMAELLDRVAQQFAEDLTPKDRGAPPPAEDTAAPEDAVRPSQEPPAAPPVPALPPGELPPPDEEEAPPAQPQQ